MEFKNHVMHPNLPLLDTVYQHCFAKIYYPNEVEELKEQIMPLRYRQFVTSLVHDIIPVTNNKVVLFVAVTLIKESNPRAMPA